MGCRNRELTEDGALSSSSSSSSSLSEALLFATMCIIGLPVDVHVRDGSVYSGIFHTASVENEYGIVLKKARMTKKGKSDANVANGELIDTLVIRSGDLVQVVTKGVLLPADGVAGMSGDRTESVVGTVYSDECSKNAVKKSIESNIHKKKGGSATRTRASKEHGGRNMPPNHIENVSDLVNKRSDGANLSEIRESSGASMNRRQVDDGPQGKQDDLNQKLDVHRKESDTKMASKLGPFGVSCDPSNTNSQRDTQCCEMTTSEYTSPSANVVSSGSSTFLNPANNFSIRNTEPTSTEMIPDGSELNKSGKEFKLNPGAKVFSPSYTKSIAATSPALPAVASMGFIPTNRPVVPGPAIQPEVGSNPFPSRTSVPVKVAPYNNFTTGNGGDASQFSQPIVGHIRAQTVRYAGQYPVQAGPTYVHPNPQAVMVGRFGQLVYVHPVSQDLVQGTPAIPPLSARPMLSPHQIQFPKHQGTAGQSLQLCVPPQFMATGQQPFPIAKSHPIFATSLPF
ncbi:polyadenylate-binding protein-interacting protein 4 isoform X2 [Argentina anserina]|uniref:polyadenylate-binding protein-interacting protein 4 isoform X2 n=1 Tax=Argentina anserina TaxID=57926 RepID=UPI0021768517|nr:polyadenylate-binding protein-interacting protein 4 isoform X2 [Potentilla anserina]